jgi:nitrate reductase gamma subunit
MIGSSGFEGTVMKGIATIVLVLTTIILSGLEARASWFIDAAKLHISAHGQLSCQDCHEEVAERDIHPNPSDVNKERRDFFSIDQCLLCHEEILDNLEQGFHGSIRVQEPKRYEQCLQCHSPHYQLKVEGGRFDPAKPPHEQCGACHEEQSSLPATSTEDEACMGCHGSVDPNDPHGTTRVGSLCLYCHGEMGTQAQKMTGQFIPLIDGKQYQSTPHARFACTVCHPGSPQFNHADQRLGDCEQCHLPHDEKVAHDVHAVVTCEACHLKGVKPVRDPVSKLVLWEKERKPGEPSRIHEMVRADEEALCRRCHFKGNKVGAASVVLPAKSILCMPCHAATFSVADTTTILALIVFLAGLALILSVFLSGSLPGEGDVGPFRKIVKLLGQVLRTLCSSKILLVIKAMALDVLLQRRLYRQSGIRWFIHSLIFLPFVFRFLWGLVALTASLWRPEWSAAWAMLDKNHPATAFLFDLTGAMIVAGVISAFIRGGLRQSSQVPGLPRQDRLALGLIAGIVAIGFILEGIRIAMTGWPESAEYAVIGIGISRLFQDPARLTEVYGYVWYVHAILTGAFVAYVPFSGLLHIIMAPVVLAMNELSQYGRSRR